MRERAVATREAINTGHPVIIWRSFSESRRALTPDPARPHMSISTEFDRAFRLHQEGKLREAFLRYDAVLAADPNNAPALHYSGVVLFQAGKIPEAAERIRASLKLEPTSPDAWSNLALVLDSAGRREAAVNALKRGRETRAGLAANTRATCRRQSSRSEAPPKPKRRRGAPSLPTRATRRVGTISRWRWNRRAGCWKRWTQHRVQPRSRRKSPPMPASRRNSKITAGMRKKARTTLDAALARTPAPASLQFELAGLLERENDPAGAMQAYENAVRLDPKPRRSVVAAPVPAPTVGRLA